MISDANVMQYGSELESMRDASHAVAKICRKIRGGQGQSGQAIKLFQITPYVNDFQTLNNLGS